MNLKKYTWNNGTLNSPIVLTNEQIKKFVEIGKREDIESNVSGYVTTNSRKMQKYLKYSLEQQYPNLNIVCDEELADSFTLRMDNNVFKEGTSNPIHIESDNNITHNFLKWKYEYSNTTIDGDISEQQIKNKIQVIDGKLVISEPLENASWSTTLKLTAYPIYYTEEEFNSIPVTSRPDIIITIVAKKIQDIEVSTKTTYPINSKVEVKITPVPEDSTKLKGATYSYSTTTPDLITINTSSLGTEIISKKEGKADIIVTLTACNGTVTKSNKVEFNIYSVVPVRYIVNQTGSVVAPNAMISDNYILNKETGNLDFLSSSGSTGDPNTNILTWIRQNSHLYVGRFGSNNIMRLKQLDDKDRTKYADGTSSANDICNESGEYDVWLKFPCDIYYTCEPWNITGKTEKDENYVLITISTEIPYDEQDKNWQKWDGNHLIAVYKCTLVNGVPHSLSGHKVSSNEVKWNVLHNRINNRGINFRPINYDVQKLLFVLTSGWYGTTDVLSNIGIGTNTKKPNENIYYNLVTGVNDKIGMRDTTYEEGTCTKDYEEITEQLEAGTGDDIKVANIWGLEDKFNGNPEIFEGIRYTRKIDYSGEDGDYPLDYIDCYGNITTVNNKEELKEAFNIDSNMDFLGLYLIHKDYNSNDKVKLCVSVGWFEKNRIPKRITFGKYFLLFTKYNGNYGSNATTAEYFAASVHTVYAADQVLGANSIQDSASNPIHMVPYVPTIMWGTRMIFKGNENNIHIIDDATEEL